MTRETFLVEVPCQLTEVAVLDAYDRAHKIEARADELAETLKASSKDRKDDIRRMRAEARTHRLMAAGRVEIRDVPCYEELRGSQVVTIRTDTGVVIDQRAATPFDQQQVFPGLDHSSDDEPSLPSDLDLSPPKAPNRTLRAPRKPRKARQNGVTVPGEAS